MGTSGQLGPARDANGSASAAAALAGVGLSIEQLNGKSSEERFQAIAEALAAMPNTAERTAAAIALFGKSGAGLLPLFEDGAAGLQAMQDEAKKFGLALNDVQGTNVEAMNDSFTRGERSVENFFTQGCGYCDGWTGCHNVTFASFSYALPFGKLHNSNCIPHGLKK
jgi:hypothetical protein